MIQEFNVNSKADCVQLNLAHIARKKYKKEETKMPDMTMAIVSVQ